MREEPTSAATHKAFDLVHLCQYFSERSPHAMLAVEGASFLVRHVNAAFLRLSGFKRSDLMGRAFALAVPERMANGVGAMMDRVYRSGVAENLAEQQHQGESQAYWSYAVWAILGGSELPGERPVGVMIQVTDTTEIAIFRAQATAMNQALLLSGISQQEMAETEAALNKHLEAAIKEKEYFIAVLSHELRTPLTPILLSSMWMREDARLPAEVREVMRMIHRNVALEVRLIDDLLDMTRLERGKLELKRHCVDLRKVVETAIDMLRVDMEAGRLKLGVEMGDKERLVDADAERLVQVISNLLRNSIKFTPVGGNISVRCDRDGACWAVTVADTGSGMDAAFVPRAFDAFAQGQKAQARVAGLGLGLAICKTIVELHGGTISAASDGKDRGASFVVRLPAWSDAGAMKVIEGRTEPKGRPATKALRILLVEDHVDSARAMRTLLLSEGHSVRLAVDMATALRAAETEEFDVLVSDVGLPDGTGWELMRQLRAGGSRMPGIVMTGYGEDADVARSHEAGYAMHLTKPFSPEKLFEAIGGVVG